MVFRLEGWDSQGTSGQQWSHTTQKDALFTFCSCLVMPSQPAGGSCSKLGACSLLTGTAQISVILSDWGRGNATHNDDEGEHHKHEAEPDLQLGKRRVVCLPLKREHRGGDGDRQCLCEHAMCKTPKGRSAPEGETPDSQKQFSHGEGPGRHRITA